MGGTREDEKYVQNFSQEAQEEGSLEDVCVDGRTVLKGTVKK
jgi:hypothetical protein